MIFWMEGIILFFLILWITHLKVPLLNAQHKYFVWLDVLGGGMCKNVKWNSYFRCGKPYVFLVLLPLTTNYLLIMF